MATAIGDLIVRLFGDTSRFERSMTRMRGLLGGTIGFVARLTRAFMPLSGALLVAGILRSGERFNQQMRSSLAIMGELSDTMVGKMRAGALRVAAVNSALGNPWNIP